MPDLKPNDYLNDAKQFAHSAILNWGTDQPESNAAIAAASANALISIADSLARDRAEKAEAALGQVRKVLAEHPGSAWDSGIKLQAALKAALDGE